MVVMVMVIQNKNKQIQTKMFETQ